MQLWSEKERKLFMFKKDNTIQFIGPEHFLNLEDIQPQPAKNFIPQWFRDMPLKHINVNTNFFFNSTAKACPSFVDYFTMGFVIPAWADIAMSVTDEGPVGKITKNRDSIESHEKWAFLDHTNLYKDTVKSTAVFKLQNPWAVIAPKGWSVLQVPMFYNSNQDWQALAGSFDADIWHEANIHISYHGNGKEIFIKRGTPLVQYIPYKREKLKHSIKAYNPQIVNQLKIMNADVFSRFNHGYLDRRRKEQES